MEGREAGSTGVTYRQIQATAKRKKRVTQKLITTTERDGKDERLKRGNEGSQAILAYSMRCEPKGRGYMPPVRPPEPTQLRQGPQCVCDPPSTQATS